MKTPIRLCAALLAGLMTLTACGPVFESESGSVTDTGSFGNATMNNTMLQSGELSYAVILGERFAKEVPTTINFAFDSAVLDAQARAVLDRQAHWIRQFPEARFRVYGHTDLVGSAAYNQRLGQRRANAAVAYLVSRGVSRSRLEGVVSLGQTQPLIVTDQPEMRNRRTVTEISGFVRRHPTVLNGRYAEIIAREYIASAVRPLPQISRTRTATGGSSN